MGEHKRRLRVQVNSSSKGRTDSKRGFVYDRKLTAISSYNRVVFWPELVPLKNSLETRLRNKWIEIEPKVTPHLRNFIV